MMREARINLPVTDNNGQSLARVRDKLARRLAETFGGFTLTRGRGGWVSPDGRLYDEPVHVFEIAMNATRENITALRRIARWALKEAQQEAIYVRLPTGAVEFIA